ncbi:hypothetical protein [Rhodococcoides fascians]|uniref:hypothetical protein n=1 Tax=Rhodococcoides fascians TaxID=1828 RepID=UPI00050C12FF|nr:hypothetical protein [Rhodococcus fascians]
MPESTTTERGAVLVDYESRDFPVFRPIADLSPDQYDRFSDAYATLAACRDESMFNFVRACVMDLIDYIVKVGNTAIETRSVPRTDERGSDVGEYVRTLSLSASNAFFVYRDHRTHAAKVLSEKRGDSTKTTIKSMLDDLNANCFGYRWLLELRNALMHMDLRSVSFSVKVSANAEPSFTLNMDREQVLQTNNLKNARNAALREELKALPDDPSVIDLLQEALPAIAETEREVLKALYPESVRRDAGLVVCELIDLFEGRRGTYCLFTGPGFTAEHRIPPHYRLEPEVLSHAETYR